MSPEEQIEQAKKALECVSEGELEMFYEEEAKRLGKSKREVIVDVGFNVEYYLGV